MSHRETLELLWLAVKAAGESPGKVTIRMSDLPAGYAVYITKDTKDPQGQDVLTITAAIEK